MIKSPMMPNKRNEFFENLEKDSFDKLVKKNTYHPPLYKRAINKLKSIIKRILKR